MRLRILCLSVLPLFVAPVHAAGGFEQEVRAGVEEIFVFRTVRTSRVTGATPACSGAPFVSAAEDFYELWSVETRARDSRLVRTHEKRVGEFRACFTALTRGESLKMYAMGNTGGIAWNSLGECLVATTVQAPTKTLLPLVCSASISGLPSGYVGGMFSSSSLAPALGPGADPAAHVPGYLSTSVVTMRLWKAPSQ